ncbi:MAG: hypothetical protein VX519_12280 [Myxococcota bacterium]|nr:hypothetical protein [Myxococcota bacterium]
MGSRVDEARSSGELPPAQEGPGLLTGAPVDRLPELLAHAGFRNAQPEAVESVLDTWGVPSPIREDLQAYMQHLQAGNVKVENLGEHMTAFVLERHDPGGGLRSMTESEVLSLGLAITLGNQSILEDKLENDVNSRMLHCAHASEPGVLISSYAAKAVEALKARGHSCTAVRISESK